MKDNCPLYFYVLNYNFNARRIENFNIFQNGVLRDAVVAEIKKHLRNKRKYPFEQFAERVKQLISGQERSRREYEIGVGDAFETDCSKLEKGDCYGQTAPNYEIIAREVIYQYKQGLKTTNM